MTAEQPSIDNGSKPFVEFMKKVGIVAGAVIAVVAISNTLGGFIFAQAMQPITREIQAQVAEERVARVKADEALIAGLNDVSAILSIIDVPAGTERERRIDRMRAAWEMHQKEATGGKP